MSIYLNGSVVSGASKPEWGNIEGDLNDQKDLLAVLDSKANTSDIPDVSNFATKSEIPTDYATKTELTNGLATKQNTLNAAQLNSVNSGITSAKVNEISAKIPKTLGETVPTTNTNLNEYKAGEIYGGALKNGFFTGMNMLCGNKNHFYRAPNNGYTITCNYGSSSWYQGTLFDGNMASGGYHIVEDMSVFKDNPFVLTIQKNSGTIDATDVLNLSFHGHRNWAPISGTNSLIHSYKIETYVPASSRWEIVCQAEGLTTANCPFKSSIPMFALFNKTNSTKTGTYNYNSPSAVRITFYGACVGYLDLSEIQLNESRGSTPFITAINGVSRGGDTILGDLSVNGTLRGGQVNSSGAVSATTSLNGQNIELKSSTPFIDFHFNNSTADYTSRIIEETSGTLTITGGLKVNGTLTGNLTGTATKATGDGNGNVIVNTYATKTELNAKQDKGNYALKSEIPTNNNQLTNGAGYITSDYHDNTKQDVISDLATIRSGASKGATALQSIPTEYITETELNAKGYLTQHQDISHLATKTELGAKQNTLIPGENITIENNVISAKSGSTSIGTMAIGAIISLNANENYVPEGTLPCDGAEYTKAQFEQFYTNYLASGKLKTCTYTEYTSEINATGQCSKFALDTTNNKFKVPLIPNKQVSDINDSVPVIGNGMTLGLTINNQNAGLIQVNVNNQYSVLEAVQSEYGKDLNNSGTTWDWVLGARHNAGVTTDSNKSGIIADTSNSKKYLDFRYFVVVANGSINQSMMDWSQWASNLSSKADKSEVESLKARYVVAKSDKSILPSWWTVYSDGWIEQGGQAVITGATITFLKPFTTANYFATANDYGANQNAFTVSIKDKTTTTCKTYQNNGNTTFNCDWYACGY